MSEALQQGNADGLCGMYAVLNFLRRTPTWHDPNPANDFWYILKACRHFGWLTPQYLTTGFEDFQVKRVLDYQFENYRRPFAAFFNDEVQRTTRFSTFGALAKAVYDKGGSIVANSGRRNHWLLVTPEDGRMVVVDSAASNSREPIQPLKEGQRSLSLLGSVVVLPRELPRMKIDL